MVDSRVLIPRPETELLVEVALELPAGARVHDVGTGSGAVALALQRRAPGPGRERLGRFARRGRGCARRTGCLDAFVHDGLPGGAFDLVVANLPYVREDEWAGLAPEIRLYEPREALVAGADGLDAIRSLVAQAPPGTALGAGARARANGSDQGAAALAARLSRSRRLRA